MCEKVKSYEWKAECQAGFGFSECLRCFSLFTGLKSSWVPDLEVWVSLGSRDLHWGLWSSGLNHSTFIFGSKMGFGCGSGMIPSHLKSTPRFSVLSPPLWLHSTWTGGFLLQTDAILDNVLSVQISMFLVSRFLMMTQLILIFQFSRQSKPFFPSKLEVKSKHRKNKLLYFLFFGILSLPSYFFSQWERVQSQIRICD